MKVKINPEIYPFTRKGELFLSYGRFGDLFYKIESLFRKDPDKPKYTHCKNKKWEK